jgi:Ca2+-transporting ATPase
LVALTWIKFFSSHFNIFAIYTAGKAARRRVIRPKLETTTAKMPALLPDTPHALPVADALARLGVSIAGGLSEDEVKRRRAAFGPNTIAARRKTSTLALLLHQFQSAVVYLLSAAAALAFYFRQLEEGGAIVAVLAVNALIGFLTELKAARSIEALRALGTRSARVRRDGHVRLILAEETVPGDIVMLEAGDSISADLRLVEASSVAFV